MMLYLDRLCGAGNLICDGRTVARADCEFDGFLTKFGQVTGGGEIRLLRDVLESVSGEKAHRLMSDDSRLLQLRLSKSRPPGTANDTAHVDVSGELPPESEWSH